MSVKQPTLGLQQTQRLFFRAICYPTGIDDFVASIAPEERELFHATFVGTENFARNERMSLYADAYFYRLKDVLESTFSVTSARLGPERFHNCVTDYVLDCGSESPNLHHLGDKFPEYLGNHTAPERCPLEANERTQLVATARVELALAKALEVADAELLTSSALAEIAPAEWQGLRFEFVPSLELINGGGAYEEDEAHKQAPLVAWRKGYKTMTKVIDSREAALLSALRSGLSFSEACMIFERAGGSAADVAHTLVAWIDRGWLAAGLQRSQSSPSIGS